MFDQCKACGYTLQYQPTIDEVVKCPRCGMMHVVLENWLCGTHLAYTPNIGEEAECPNCHTVHEIIAGGLLKLKGG
jgi:nitrate/TMAO reductase-like tetraheme cytochrome c subunit